MPDGSQPEYDARHANALLERVIKAGLATRAGIGPDMVFLELSEAGKRIVGALSEFDQCIGPLDDADLGLLYYLFTNGKIINQS